MTDRAPLSLFPTPAEPSPQVPLYLTAPQEAAERVVQAFERLAAGLEALRTQPALQETWPDYLLRVVMSSPEWREMRHAAKAWRERG